MAAGIKPLVPKPMGKSYRLFPNQPRSCQSVYGWLGSLPQAGADIIVNTDADNQYCADDLKLIQPILLNQAEIVVQNFWPIWKTKQFPRRKLLQKLEA